MSFSVFIIFATALILPYYHCSASCGCRYMTTDYSEMLRELITPGETECIENAAIGTSTITVFLEALAQHFPTLIKVVSKHLTYEGRALHEVIINGTEWKQKSDPVIVIEAGQDAGSETVRMALFIIEQLLACEENTDLIKKTRWVILPSTNPDGMEYMRVKREYWQKNLRLLYNISYGVDITRNFDVSWDLCDLEHNIFSHNYPGTKPGSENETVFISNVLGTHNERDTLKAYVSFRRDGHGIYYPYSGSKSPLSTSPSTNKIVQIAGNIATKVNKKAGSLQWFANESIFTMNGKPHCGNSVDYAYSVVKIPYAYEMRLFIESDNEILAKFQSLPKMYDASLRLGYFIGIKELHSSISSIKNTKNYK